MKFPDEFLEIVEGIKSMKIRGAGLIGRKAVEALKIVSDSINTADPEKYVKEIRKAAKMLISTRPTAVSLPNAVRYVYYRVKRAYESGLGVKELKDTLRDAANDFITISLNAIEKIGEIGAKRIEDGDTILTHCNSQAAISIIIHAFKQGKNIKVFATETRPRMQGRLTAKQLSNEGIPTTLIVDSAVRYFMPKIDKVVIGADAIAANGAVINKIGTSLIALAAHEARVRVMVGAETYKFSPETVFGELIKIEERPYDEVVPEEWLKANPGVSVRNPAFDVTPPEYIDVIITEMGVVSPQSFFLLVKDVFGWMFGEKDEWISLDTFHL